MKYSWSPRLTHLLYTLSQPHQSSPWQDTSVRDKHECYRRSIKDESMQHSANQNAASAQTDAAVTIGSPSHWQNWYNIIMLTSGLLISCMSQAGEELGTRKQKRKEKGWTLGGGGRTRRKGLSLDHHLTPSNSSLGAFWWVVGNKCERRGNQSKQCTAKLERILLFVLSTFQVAAQSRVFWTGFDTLRFQRGGTDQKAFYSLQELKKENVNRMLQYHSVWLG